MNTFARTTRREFVFGSVAAAATFIPAHVLGQEGKVAASEKITLGVIGIGPRCTYDLKSMLPFPDVRCVAIADVQASRRDAGKLLVDQHYGNKDCALYRDFRELLDRKDIDAVLIATGDRWHAPASILAAKAGKDVYSEKPCGITIAACQELADTIHREKRVFQAGTQRRSVPNFVKAVELVHAGKLGRLHTMHASIYLPVLDNTWLPAQPSPPREVVDWNLWLGPAAWRPFNQQYCDGKWRGQWDFDSGARLLDWGAHTVDLCQWANKADDTMPLEYEPTETNIVCRYANGVKLILDFLKTPFGDRSPHYVTRLGTCPVRFVGDEGSVETGDEAEIVAQPEALQKLIPEGSKRVRGLDVTAHSRNFFDCIRSRRMTAANPDVMRRSHIACHAAAIAWVLQRKLQLDPVKEAFIGDDEANLLRSRPARELVGLTRFPLSIGIAPRAKPRVVERSPTFYPIARTRIRVMVRSHRVVGLGLLAFVSIAMAEPKSPSTDRFKAYLDKIPAIDTHDHLWPFDKLPGYVETDQGRGMNLAGLWHNSDLKLIAKLEPWKAHASRP